MHDSIFLTNTSEIHFHEAEILCMQMMPIPTTGDVLEEADFMIFYSVNIGKLRWGANIRDTFAF